MNTDTTRRLVLALLGASLMFASSGCSRFESRMEVKKGNKAYRLGKYDEALVFYENVAPGGLDRVRAALNSGYANMAQYRFGSKHAKDMAFATEAVKAFDEYIEIRPEGRKDSEDFPPISEIDERIITLLVDGGFYPEAISRLEKKLETLPNDPALLRGLATTYDKWGQPTVAITYYQQWANHSEENDPSPYVAIAAYSWDMSYRKHSTMEPIERNRWIDVGIEASDTALDMDSEYFEGVLYKNLLLRERAKVRIDPDQIATLIGQANEFLAKAKEIREEQKAEEEAKAKAAAETAAADEETEEETGEGAH